MRKRAARTQRALDAVILQKKYKGRTQHPGFFIIETDKGTLHRNRSTLVKAELQSPSKVDKQTTLTSTASNHAVQDTEEMTGPPKLRCTATEAPMQPSPVKQLHYKHVQGELLSHLINWTFRLICLTLPGQFRRQLLHLCPSETVLCTIKSCEYLAVRFNSNSLCLQSNPG